MSRCGDTNLLPSANIEWQLTPHGEKKGTHKKMCVLNVVMKVRMNYELNIQAGCYGHLE